MLIRSAKQLTTDNCIAAVVYVLRDQENDKYLSTFELILPEEEVDLEQYDSLIEGLSFSQYKIESLLEALEMEEDDEELVEEDQEDD